MKIRLLFPLFLSGVLIAQPAGSFIPTGAMATPRYGHTATLLTDGRVLIAGGLTTSFSPTTSFNPTATAELYDSITGTFTATSNMGSPRYDHTATLLPDGRILIAGGGDGSGHLSLTAELYDPSTGTFSPTGGMLAGHWNATLLNNGKVMMGPVAPGAPIEFYDPSTGVFTPGASFLADPGPFFFAGTITSLANGRVIILTLVASPPEIYDPAAESFAPAGTMIYPHVLPGSATLLPNGKVLFAGGVIDNEDNIGEDPAYPDGIYPYGELYDPSIGSFFATGNLVEARSGHAATLLPDGSALITGGSDRVTVQAAELYYPSIGIFRSAGEMVDSRCFHGATLLSDGRVLITGGLHSSGPQPAPEVILASAEVYTPAALIAAPALFSLSGDGQGQGAIWHAITGLVASTATPAVAGEILSMYTNNLLDGGVIPPQVAFGGRLAEVLYFGPAPGYPGYYQVNFRMPAGVAPGSGVRVHLNYLNRTSNEVSIGVQ
jgi:Galactose oxidase, central domain